MAEINNSLALGIRSEPLDIGKTFLTLGQINALRTRSALEEATTAQTKQETSHRQFMYDQGGGYNPSEASTLAGTKNTIAETAGRIGNAYLSNPSDETWRSSVDEAERSGLIRNGLEKAQYLNMPREKRASVAKALQGYGQPSTSAVEQSGVPAGNRQREAGKYEPFPLPENAPIISKTEAATSSRKPVASSAAIIGDDEAVRNGLYSPTPEQIKRGIAGPTNPLPSPNVVRNPDGSISSSVTPETQGMQRSLAEDYAGYKESAKGAAMTKYLLRNMQDDADRISTGKGATFTNTAKQWIQSAQSLPGVGEAVKKITGNVSDPIAAFEALQKNAGQLTRATLKDVEGKAASEYRMIQQQLPNAEMSPRGLKLVAAQMTAPEDFKQAKLQAADRWKSANNGSLGGFEADWNKNISPSTFLFARLPAQDRDALIKNLGKTDTGRSQLDQIKRQSKWAHDHGLDEFVD